MKRSTICMTVLFLVLLTAGAASAGRAISLMRVSATMLPWLRYTVIESPSVLEVRGISEQDNEMDRDHGRDDADKDDNEKRHEEEERKALGEKTDVEIERGTVLSVETNSTDGYILSVQSFESDVFTSVKIRVEKGGPSFVLSPGDSVEAHIPYNGKRRDTKELSYDFSISPYAEAGSYPWPIIVTIRPL